MTKPSTLKGLRLPNYLYYMNENETKQAKMRELLEKFAEIEHNRWAKWQKYVHSKMIADGNDEYALLPLELYHRWERQISTEYKDLSEQEKESDREQVYPYIKYIETLYKSTEKLVEALQHIMTMAREDDSDDVYECLWLIGEEAEKALDEYFRALFSLSPSSPHHD